MTVAAQGGIDVFGLSDVGLARKHNEDHFVIASLRKAVDLRQTNLENHDVFERLRGAEAQLLAVADGVGGIAGGAVASRTAVNSLLEYLARAAGCFNALDTDREQDFLADLEAAVLDAHQRVRKSVPGGRPATTLTMVTLVWPRAYLVHVGDSRAMYLHKGALRRLTRDQTMAEEMVDAGAMTEESASKSPLASTLYSAVGGSEIAPTVGLVDFVPGDVLLMCSDGLTKHVSDARITKVLSDTLSARGMAQQLVADALAGGGSDNVTVIVARMTG